MTRRIRLRRLSKAMSWASLVLASLLVVGEIGLWFLFEPCKDWLPGESAGGLSSGGLSAGGLTADLCAGAVDGLPSAKRLGGFAIAMLPAAAGIFGLLALHRLFRLYAAGQVFTRANTRALRQFAAAVLAYGLTRPLAYSLTVLLMTYDNPPGQRHLAIQMSDGEVTALFLGVLFLAIAWVMDEARELAEDQAQIV